MNLGVDILGWIGSVLLITAYILISRNKITAQDATYQWLNLIGSFLLIINTGFYGAYPSTAVNIVWVFIGIYFLRNIFLKKKPN